MPRTPRPKSRIIIPGDAYPENHEIATAHVLANLNLGDVEFLVPSRTQGVCTPDITWRGLDWEIKSPVGAGKRMVEGLLRKALRQSKNVIFDNRRSRTKSLVILKELRRQAKMTHSLKRLVFIDKEEDVIDIEK